MADRLGIPPSEGLPLQVLPDDPPDVMIVEGRELPEVLKPDPGQGLDDPTERIPECLPEGNKRF